MSLKDYYKGELMLYEKVALGEVHANIPPRILKKAFSANDDYGFETYSVDDNIKANVMRCRVDQALNLLGGIQMYVPTYEATKVKQIDTKTLYVFPPNALDNLSITSVMDFDTRTLYGARGGCGSPLTCRIGKSCDNGDPGGLYAKAYKKAVWEKNREEYRAPMGSMYVRGVGPNAAMILETSTPPVGTFTFLMTHEPGFEDMPPRTALYYAKIVVEATKAYIYNNYMLELSEGDATRGYVLSAVGNAIERYSDAEEKYQELLQGWGKLTFESDPHRMNEYIKGMIDPYELF